MSDDVHHPQSHYDPLKCPSSKRPCEGIPYPATHRQQLACYSSCLELVDLARPVTGLAAPYVPEVDETLLSDPMAKRLPPPRFEDSRWAVVDGKVMSSPYEDDPRLGFPLQSGTVYPPHVRLAAGIVTVCLVAVCIAASLAAVAWLTTWVFTR